VTTRKETIMKTRITSSMLTKTIAAVADWPLLTLVAGLAVAGFSPGARAQCNQGCFPAFNTVFGDGAMPNPTNIGKTAIGSLTLQDEAAGDDNTALGSQALSGFVSGTGNTAVGSIALLNPGQGNYNTAIGYSAMGTGGDCSDPRNDNTAAGVFALYSNICGDSNTATGSYALYGNIDGSYNTADGARALYSNTEGVWNTATGWGALSTNRDGSYNTADGLQALVSNTTGNENTALGLNALFSNTTGSRNIALGAGAGGALTTGDDNIDIGNSGTAGESGTIRIGITGAHRNTYIAGIYGAATSRTSVPVFVDSAGHLGTNRSSARFKEAIKPMDKTSEAILKLQPVTFRYKHELDPDGTPQFGLLAEEVAKVNPDLVVRDEEGKPYTVRYEAVNAMLLNEFLKEHRKVEEQSQINQQQEATIAQQQNQIAALTSTIQEQALQIQKVSARVAAADQSAGRVAVSSQ
jgi:trimeric autotransporter adhesin